MRRRRWPAALTLAAVILGLLVAADVLARSVAERKLADRVARQVPDAEAASVRIRSFPFLARLLAGGRVPGVEVSARGLDVRGLRFASVTAELHGVDIDRAELLQHGRVMVEQVRQGTVRAVVTSQALEGLTGVPIRLEDGRATVTVGGIEVGAEVAVRDGRLVIGGTGVAIPGIELGAPLLPCLPDADIRPGRVELSCTFTEVPRELVV